MRTDKSYMKNNIEFTMNNIKANKTKNKKPISRYFDNTVLGLIILSSILLAIDNPL